MRNRTLVALAVCLGPLSFACSNNGSSSGNDAGADEGGNGEPDGGTTGGDGGGTPADGSAHDGGTSGNDGGTPAPDGGGVSDAGSGMAMVRVAHLSPDAPAVDFCLAAHGTTSFTGPVLKSMSNTTGLPYASVTQYIPVPAAQYDVRLVAPNAADCSASLAGLPDFKSLPALAAGGSFTVAAEGQVTAGGTPFTLAAYVDDATVASGKASLRFVHASPGTPAVDVGTGAGSSFAALFSNVAFGAATTGGTGVDGNGYLTTAPLSKVELSARAHGGTTDALVIPSASLPANAVATAFAIGVLGNTKTPLAALLCVDNAAPANGLSSCSVVGDSLAHVRVAHLSPDAPAVDVCLKSHASSTWPSKPLLASLNTPGGLSYPQVTTYVPLAVDAYDIRIVAAGATDCSTALTGIADTNNVAVSVGLYATVAATGDATVAGSDPAFALKVFVDERTVASGMASLRFIHASPGTGAVDVGTGTGSSFTKVFSNVAFGTVAATSSAIDANGYFATAPLSSVSLTARLTGQSTDAKTVSGVSVAAGGIVTAIAIGAKTGASTNPLQVLLCQDSAAASGVLTSCSAM